MLSAKELREIFCSFTTFSVFVRPKAKGKGILGQSVLPSVRLLLSATVVGTCTGNHGGGHGALSRMHLTPAPRSPLAGGGASTKMCAHLARARLRLAIFPFLVVDGSRSREELLRPVYRRTKVRLACRKLKPVAALSDVRAF